MGKRLTVQGLAEKREQAALVGAVESTLEALKIADREQSGCLITQRGRLIRKRKVGVQYVSQVASMMHSVSVAQKSLVQVRPGAEVQAWNAMVKADKAIVLAGGRSMLVKVVKRQPDAVTRLGELIQRAMVAANTAE